MDHQGPAQGVQDTSIHKSRATLKQTSQTENNSAILINRTQNKLEKGHSQNEQIGYRSMFIIFHRTLTEGHHGHQCCWCCRLFQALHFSLVEWVQLQYHSVPERISCVSWWKNCWAYKEFNAACTVNKTSNEDLELKLMVVGLFGTCGTVGYLCSMEKIEAPGPRLISL